MVKWYQTHKVNLLCCCLLLGLLVTGPSGLLAQEVPEFEVDAISVRTDEASAQTRLDIYIKIPYSNLDFIHTANGFRAAYEVEAEVYELDERERPGNLVQAPIWEHTATETIFALTQSDQTFDYTTHSLSLPPGRYLIECTVTDKNSQESSVDDLVVEVRDLSAPIALSDIILLKGYQEETRTISPLISSRIDASALSFKIFYEIYADQPRRVRVVREVFPMRKSRGSRLIRSLLGLKNKEADAVVLYSDEEVTALDRGRHQIVASIPLQELLEVGEYLVQVRLEDENGQQLAVSERAFSTRWTGLAAHLLDLDEAIDQLAYIAKPKDIRAFKEAPTEGERLKRFEEFWKKRDPTPRTGRNERMEEYYYRIDYANRVFGNIMPGWKTDRGHVLMEFGYPDLIDRQTYSFGAEPWEVWYYYRIARQYIFVDKTGFGDYELMVPIWDERTRIR